MKIKLTRDYVGHKKGTVLDLPDGNAQRFIDRGNAEKVTAKSTKKSDDSKA